jgi:hypothetical protein
MLGNMLKARLGFALVVSDGAAVTGASAAGRMYTGAALLGADDAKTLGMEDKETEGELDWVEGGRDGLQFSQVSLQILKALLSLLQSSAILFGLNDNQAHERCCPIHSNFSTALSWQLSSQRLQVSGHLDHAFSVSTQYFGTSLGFAAR